MEKKKKKKKTQKYRTEVWKSAVGGGKLDRLSDDVGISRDLEPADEFAAARRGQEKHHQALRSTVTLL